MAQSVGDLSGDELKMLRDVVRNCMDDGLDRQSETGQLESTRCEHDWQVEGINLRRDSTGVIQCSKCGSRQEDVVLTDDQIWRFISDHIIG